MKIKVGNKEDAAMMLKEILAKLERLDVVFENDPTIPFVKGLLSQVQTFHCKNCGEVIEFRPNSWVHPELESDGGPSAEWCDYYSAYDKAEPKED